MRKISEEELKNILENHKLRLQFNKDDEECLLMIMNNEVLLKAFMITDRKKNYASFQEVQEGNLVPPEAGGLIKVNRKPKNAK